jgi:HNH endonuclease
MPEVADVLRFHSKIRRETSDGCWEWMGTRFDSGYGAFHLKGKLRRAHRVMWEWSNGSTPDGVFVCHHCDNPACVNPVHLFLGTPQDNMTDKVNKGRLVASPGQRNGMWGKYKSHCKHGHPLSGQNLMVISGERRCRACRYATHKRWRKKKAYAESA